MRNYFIFLNSIKPTAIEWALCFLYQPLKDINQQCKTTLLHSRALSGERNSCRRRTRTRRPVDCAPSDPGQALKAPRHPKYHGEILNTKKRCCTWIDEISNLPIRSRDGIYRFHFIFSAHFTAFIYKQINNHARIKRIMLPKLFSSWNIQGVGVTTEKICLLPHKKISPGP